MNNFINIKLEGFDEALAMYDHQVVRAAAYNSIRRAVNGMVTDTSSEVRSTYNVRKRDIDQRIQKLSSEDYYNLSGGIQISGGVNEHTSAIPLIMFGAVGRHNTARGSVKTAKGKDGYYSKLLKRRTAEGVSHKVLKSGGRGYSPQAFIIPGARGSLQVVRRTGSGKMAIKEMRVLSMASMVASKGRGIVDRIMVKAQDRFQKNFKNDLLYYMGRLEAGFNPGWGGMRRLR